MREIPRLFGVKNGQRVEEVKNHCQNALNVENNSQQKNRKHHHLIYAQIVSGNLRRKIKVT